jgi:hypothetical protein
MKFTLADLIRFTLQHRRNKVFKGQTVQQIGWALERAVNQRGLALAVTEKNEIVGICCATPMHEHKVLRVHEVLCIAPGALSAIVEKYREWFNGYAITARRRGQEVQYQTGRLIHLLEHL